MIMGLEEDGPVAMAVKKDQPMEATVPHLPHVKAVIDEAPPEYIVMIVVAFLQVFAMSISLVHIVNKHRAFIRNKPGMVGPTIALLSFYWVIATLNLLGLFVLRANLLCQTICSCYDAVIGYFFAVLAIAYAHGKLSYLSVLRWREVPPSAYSCSSLCVMGVVTQPRAERAVSYITQLILVFTATSLAELICEGEEVYVYPAPLTKSYITFGLKCVQGVSFLFALCGFVVLCRAAAIVSPRSSPFIKLSLYKCIYILSALQGNVFLYLAFHKILPAVSDIAPITRSVVWTNFATVTECTLAYFISIRVYKMEEYRGVLGSTGEYRGASNIWKSGSLGRALEGVQSRDAFYRSTLEGQKRGEVGDTLSDLEGAASTPELQLDHHDLLHLKLLGLKVNLPAEESDKDSSSMSSLKRDPMLGMSSEEQLDLIRYKENLRKDSQALRSVEAMITSQPTKSARIIRTEKSGYSKVPQTDEAEPGARVEPKIRIVGGKFNISLSSADLAKLCASGPEEGVPVSLQVEEVSEEEGPGDEAPIPRAARGVTFEAAGKPRHSMQFVKSFSYTKLNGDSSEDEEAEHPEHVGRSPTDPSQYVSKISLV